MLIKPVINSQKVKDERAEEEYEHLVLDYTQHVIYDYTNLNHDQLLFFQSMLLLLKGSDCMCQFKNPEVKGGGSFFFSSSSLSSSPQL